MRWYKVSFLFRLPARMNPFGRASAYFTIYVFVFHLTPRNHETAQKRNNLPTLGIFVIAYSKTHKLPIGKNKLDECNRQAEAI